MKKILLLLAVGLISFQSFSQKRSKSDRSVFPNKNTTAQYEFMIIKGYSSIRNLSKEELFYLPLLSQAAAMRFLLTRLYDWVNTPKSANVVPKNPKEYITKLRYHRQITANKSYNESIK